MVSVFCDIKKLSIIPFDPGRSPVLKSTVSLLLHPQPRTDLLMSYFSVFLVFHRSYVVN